MEAELFRADRRTDEHDEANSRFSQVCERAWKKKTADYIVGYPVTYQN